MSCQQNTILIENACDAFIDQYLDNPVFRSMIQEHYFTQQQQWYAKEFDRSEKWVEAVFENLLSLDFEETCRDAVGFAWKNYRQNNKRV